MVTRRISSLNEVHGVADRVVAIYSCLAFGCVGPSGEVSGGNPAAVVALREPLSVAERSAVAQAIGLPMTAFVLPTPVSTAHWISYYSASGDEFQICGHASMAASRALAGQLGERQIELLLSKPFPTFATIPTRVSASASQVSVTLPLATIEPCTEPVAPWVVADLASIDVDTIEEIAVSSIGDLLISLASPRALNSVDLDEESAREWSRASGYRGLLFTCVSERSTHDFETRAFFPALGIGEDVACGSANCTVVPYWLARLGGSPRSVRVGYPSSAGGGIAMGGEMEVTLDVSAATVTIRGSVVVCDPSDIARVISELPDTGGSWQNVRLQQQRASRPARSTSHADPCQVPRDRRRPT